MGSNGEHIVMQKRSDGVHRSQSCRVARSAAAAVRAKTAAREKWPRQLPRSATRSRAASLSAAVGCSPELADFAECVRNFQSTKSGGIVNRGDSFHVSANGCHNIHGLAHCFDRRLSLQVPLLIDERVWPTRQRLEVDVEEMRESSPSPQQHHVWIIGAAGVGKQSIARQFQTSECTDDLDYGSEEENSSFQVSVCLNSVTTRLTIRIADFNPHEEVGDSEAAYDASVVVVMYSVDSEQSFGVARHLCDQVRSVSPEAPIILVANKCDLVRGRQVTHKEGRSQAVELACKYIETSVLISSNVDELLAGVVAQCRLTSATYAADSVTRNSGEHLHWPEDGAKKRKSWSGGAVAAGVKPRAGSFRETVQRLIGRRSELKYCQNLHTR